MQAEIISNDLDGYSPVFKHGNYKPLCSKDFDNWATCQWTQRKPIMLAEKAHKWTKFAVLKVFIIQQVWY